MLEQNSAAFATNSGVPNPNLNHLAAVARELAANSFLQYLKNNASSAAEQSGDPSLKAHVLENEILSDIVAGKFDSADAKIFRIEDANTREAVTDYLYVARIKKALKRQDWPSVDADVEKLTNWNVKS